MDVGRIVIKGSYNGMFGYCEGMGSGEGSKRAENIGFGAKYRNVGIKNCRFEIFETATIFETYEQRIVGVEICFKVAFL